MMWNYYALNVAQFLFREQRKNTPFKVINSYLVFCIFYDNVSSNQVYVKANTVKFFRYF